MTSHEKIIKFWEENGESIAGSPALAAMARPMLEARVFGDPVEKTDDDLAKMAEILLALRSDDAPTYTLEPNPFAGATAE